jgi:outer membrane protein TolC
MVSWTVCRGNCFRRRKRRSLNDQARAAYDYQVAAYRENVLTGFQRVEDNLAAVRILENEAKVQDEAVVGAQKSLTFANEVTAVNILGRRMANTVLLIQALGGGWDGSTLPEQPECCSKLASSNAK